MRAVRLVLLLALASIAAGGCLPPESRRTDNPAGGASSSTPTPAATAAPSGPTPLPSFVPPTPTPAPTFLVYTVTRGDSLNTIAHRFQTSARSIAFWNRGRYPSLDPESPSYRPGVIQVGWTLWVIPNALVDEQELPGPDESASPMPSAFEQP